MLRRGIWIPLFLACTILLLDAGSKFWVRENLPHVSTIVYRYPYGGIGLFEDVWGIECSINYATNKGAAWSLFSSYPNVLIGIRIILISGLMLYCFLGKMRPAWRYPLALILSGAWGNLLDAFLYGQVIDMIHFVFWGYDYPIFNIADSAICIGIFLAVIPAWCSSEKKGKKLEEKGAV